MTFVRASVRLSIGTHWAKRRRKWTGRSVSARSIVTIVVVTMRIKIMQPDVPLVVPRLIRWLAVLLILKVTFGIIYEYRNYLPPNFQSDFLLGREQHFWGSYSWAFYVHLISGPLALLLCTLLMSDRLRTAAPAWHRRLGRALAVVTLLFVVPSGLWMARYAATGLVAAIGLSLLAVATGTSVACGWQAALGKQWERHRWWMWRTFALLCSAVVLRLLGGLATVTQIDAPWTYPASIWISWLGPLTFVESARIWLNTVRE